MSFHSYHELFLIRPFILSKSEFRYHWIGLKKNQNGKYYWEDGSGLDFTHWEQRETWYYDCVAINTVNMKWSTGKCHFQLPFIFQIEKVIPNHNKTMQQNPISVVTISIIINALLLVVILALVAIYLFFSKKRKNARNANTKRKDSEIERNEYETHSNRYNSIHEDHEEYETVQYSEYYDPLYHDTSPHSRNSQYISIYSDDRNVYLSMNKVITGNNEQDIILN